MGPRFKIDRYVDVLGYFKLCNPEVSDHINRKIGVSSTGSSATDRAMLSVIPL